MTKETNDKKCLFLIAEKGKWIKNHLKPLKPIYNGVGWYIDEKFRSEVEQLSKQTNMRLIEWPLNGETFDQLRGRQKHDFLQEKSIKLKLEIDDLKTSLKIHNLNLDNLIQGDQRKELEQISEGKKLIECIEEYDNIQENLKRIEEEDRIKNINIIDPYIIQPYTLSDLQQDLSSTKEGLKTGFKELDELVRIPNEAITLVGGRPSHGKTTFMLNLFINLINQYPDHHFYFFSFEETRQQIAVKIINILSAPFIFEEAKNLIQLEGYLRAGVDSLPKVEEGKQKYQELVESGRLRIIGESYNVQDLSSIIASLKSKVPLGGVFIDYIQKIKNKIRFSTRQMELQNTSEIILETAKSCSIPIILGAQLGRDKDSKDKVKLDNLREAGDLEQDANLVLGIFNPLMEKAQEEQSQLTSRKVELKVTPLKNRNGLVNKTISLEFDRPLLTIKDKK